MAVLNALPNLVNIRHKHRFASQFESFFLVWHLVFACWVRRKRTLQYAECRESSDRRLKQLLDSSCPLCQNAQNGEIVARDMKKTAWAGMPELHTKTAGLHKEAEKTLIFGFAYILANITCSNWFDLQSGWEFSCCSWFDNLCKVYQIQVF